MTTTPVGAQRGAIFSRMDPIPFSLKVPGKDDMTRSEIATTSYRFQGQLRLEADALRLEWAGMAEVEEVSFAGVRTDRLLAAASGGFTRGAPGVPPVHGPPRP